MSACWVHKLSNIIASRIAHLGQCLGHLEGLRWLSRRVLSVGACESYKLSLLRAIGPGSVVSDSPNEGCGFGKELRWSC